jgi:hypothetical protein
MLFGVPEDDFKVVFEHGFGLEDCDIEKLED